MLDNLRAMGVFSCVVEQRSFNGAAKRLGITTSAVSQQIRSLERELNITLLHRSTRQVSLTEAGSLFFQSCQEMLQAAERGKIRLTEIQEKLIGDVRLSVTPTLAVLHIVPALSRWMQAHENLNFNLHCDYNDYLDALDSNIDIVIRLGQHGIDLDKYDVHPLVVAKQALVASPHYLHKRSHIHRPEDLVYHSLITMDIFEESEMTADLTHSAFNEKFDLSTIPSRINTNNGFIMKALCIHGHGICRTLMLSVQNELKSGELVHILPEWKLPEFTFYAVTHKQEILPTKIKRCIELLKKHFSDLPYGLG